MMGLVPLYRRDPRELPCPFHHVRTQEGGSLQLETGHHQNPAMLPPWSWAASLQRHEKYIPVVYKPPGLCYFVVVRVQTD